MDIYERTEFTKKKQVWNESKSGRNILDGGG